MAGERKLDDEDVARLRDLRADGWAQRDLAAMFRISPRHVGRLVRQEQRPAIAGLDAKALREGVAGAVNAFIADTESEFSASDEVLAANARVLAEKLDACAASDSAAAAQALARLSAELVSVLDRLGQRVPREPDERDRLKRKRDARMLALRAKTNGAAA